MSVGSGQVSATLTGTTLVVSGSFSGLTSDLDVDVAGGSHLHTGYAGQNGSIAFSLAATLDSDKLGGTWEAENNTFTLTASQVAALKERRLYVNIHTLNYPGGELRGQLLPKSDEYFAIIMSGGWEIPAVTTTARGSLVAELKGDVLHVSGSFSGLSSTADGVDEGAAHIHRAAAGGVGDPAFTMMPVFDPGYKGGVFTANNNTFRLTPSQVATLHNRRFYVDLHSILNPSGEIRGQILPMSNLYFQGRLSGINEVQPNASGASGGIAAELLGDQLVVTGTFSGLNSDFNAAIAGGAHLHVGGADATGGITIPLNTRLDTPRIGHFDAAANTFTLTEDQVDQLLGGQLYANVHTKNHPSGELRSQVRVSPNNAPAATSVASPASGTSLSSGGPSNAKFQVTWNPVSDPDGNDVVYLWQFSRSTDFGGGQLLASVNVGFDTEFNITLEDLDAILATANLPMNKTRTFYHRVIASDGSASTAGSIASIRITRGALTGPLPKPDVVTLAAPDSGAVDLEIPVDLEWNAAAYADEYLVQVSMDTSFADILFEMQTASLTAAFLPPFAGETYFWRVQGMGVGGMSPAFSNVWSFSVGSEGSLVPTLLSPEDGATGVSVDPLLRWQAPAQIAGGDGAVSKTSAIAHYHVQLASDEAFEDVIVDQDGVAEDSLQVAGLSKGTEYFWRVAGVDEQDQFTYSGPNSFTTIVAAPEAVVLVAPANGATGQSASPEFSWQVIAGVTAYQFQLSKDAGMANPVIDEDELTGTTLTPASPLDYSTGYYWRVRAMNAGGWGEWSEIRNFTTAVGTAVESDEIPTTYALHNNYPNPFNPSTNIVLDLPELTSVKLALYDVAGREVMVIASGQVPAGRHTYTVDGSLLSSGVYLYRVESSKFAQTKQMLLLK